MAEPAIRITFTDGGTTQTVAAVKSVEKAVKGVEEKAKGAGDALEEMAKLERAEAIAAFGQSSVVAGGDLSEFLNVLKETEAGTKGWASATTAGITAIESFAAAAVLAKAAMGPWGIALAAGITLLKAFADQEEQAAEKSREAAEAAKKESEERTKANGAVQSLTESLRASTAAYAAEADAADAAAAAVQGITDAELALQKARIDAEEGAESAKILKRAEAEVAAAERKAQAEMDASRARQEAARENLQRQADAGAALPEGEKGRAVGEVTKAREEFDRVSREEIARREEIGQRLELERERIRTQAGADSGTARKEEAATAAEEAKRAAEEAKAQADAERARNEQARDAALALRESIAGGEGPRFRNAGAARDFTGDLERAGRAVGQGDESAVPQLLSLLRQLTQAMERQKAGSAELRSEIDALRQAVQQL